MTVSEFLLEAKAAHAARTAYNRAADRWFALAHAKASLNDPRALEDAARGRYLRRQAAGEYDGHRSAH